MLAKKNKRKLFCARIKKTTKYYIPRIGSLSSAASGSCCCNVPSQPVTNFKNIQPANAHVDNSGRKT